MSNIVHKPLRSLGGIGEIVRDIEHSVDIPMSVAVLVAIDMDHRTELSDLGFESRTACNSTKIEIRMGISQRPTRSSAFLRGPIDKLHARHKVTKRYHGCIIQPAHMPIVQTQKDFGNRATLA